jgi:hypothetical protein
VCPQRPPQATTPELCHPTTAVVLLWTFVSHRVQPFRQWEMTMWMYPRPSCPNRPFPTELGDMEINTRIPGGGGVLAHGVDQNFGSGPAPLRKGVDNPWVSLLKLTFICLCQFLFLNVSMFLCRVSDALAALRGGSPYLRMWRSGRLIVSAANGRGHGGKGDGWRVTRSSHICKSPT